MIGDRIVKILKIEDIILIDLFDQHVIDRAEGKLITIKYYNEDRNSIDGHSRVPSRIRMDDYLLIVF